MHDAELGMRDEDQVMSRASQELIGCHGVFKAE